MKKIWIGIIIVGAAALFIGLNLYRSVQTGGGAETAVQTVKLEEKEISSEVMVPGALKFANEQYEYFEPEKGKIADIKVKEGDKVKKEMCFSPIRTKKFAWKKNRMLYPFNRRNSSLNR